MIKKLSLFFATALLVALMLPMLVFASGQDLPPDEIDDKGLPAQEMSLETEGGKESIYVDESVTIYAKLDAEVENFKSVSVSVTLDSAFAGPTSDTNSKWLLSSPDLQDFDIDTLLGAAAYNDTFTLSTGNIFQLEVSGAALKDDAEISLRFVFKGEDDVPISVATKTITISVVGKQGYVKEGSNWYFYQNDVKSTKTGAFAGVIEGETNTFYIKNGKYDSTYTGFAKLNGSGSTYYYMEDGAFASSLTSIVSGTVNSVDGWYYVKDGVYTKYTGIVSNEYGTWYVENGEVTFDYTGFVSDEAGTWWYVKGSKVQKDLTAITAGVVDGTNSKWNVESGKVIFDTKIVTRDSVLYYVENGEVTGNYKGFLENGGKWWYFENSTVDKTRSAIINGTVNGVTADWNVENGYASSATKVVTYSGVTYYCESGKVTGTYTGFASDGTNTWYFVNSVVDKTKSGIIEGTIGSKTSKWNVESGKFVKATKAVTYSDGTWYVQNGEMTGTYNGNAQDSNGVWWIFVNSKATGKASGFLKQSNGSYYYLENNVKSTKTGAFAGTINGVEGIYYVKAGVYDSTFNDFALFNATGSTYYYMVNGKADVSLTSAVSGTIAGKSGWYYVKDGIYTKANVVVSNDYGIWYAENGQIKFSYKGFAKDTTSGNTYYFSGSKAQLTKTSIESGVVDGVDGWWYFVNGVVQKVTTVASNDYGWWYVKNGQVTFNYTGVGSNSYGIWYCVKSKVGFNYKGFAKDTTSGNTYYFVGSKAQLSKTSIESGKVDGVDGWWYFVNGVVQKVTTVASNDYGWWYVKNGRVTFDYTGVGENEYGIWYCVKSKVGFNYTGFAKDKTSGNTYYFVGSKAQTNKTSIESGVVDGVDGWWYFKNGIVEKVTTVASNTYGRWYVEEGKVNFSFSGTKTIGSVEYEIEKGKVTKVDGIKLPQVTIN